MSKCLKGPSVVLKYWSTLYRMICREKVGGSQRIPLLTKKERKKMKKFKVYAWEEASWYKIIEADTKDQAEEKAYEDISKTGYVDWHIGGHGDNEIIDIEEIK